MFRVVCLVLGYFVGCINFAYIIGKTKEKIDIREFGSGNSGTTNAIRVMGWKLGALTFFGDVLKLVIAYLVMQSIYGDVLAGLYTGFGVIIGHNWPVFLKFKGGKGIAASLGLMYVVNPLAGLVVNLLMFLIILTTKMVSVGSLFLSAMIPVVTYFFGGQSIEGLILGLVLGLIGLYQHKANIKRLIEGNENKLSFGKKK